MKNLKRVFFAAVAAMALTVAIGCGDDDDTNNTPDASTIDGAQTPDAPPQQDAN